MDKQTIEHFRDMESLFRQPGWMRLVHGWREELEAIPEACFHNAKSMEEVEVFRARYRLLHQLVNLDAETERLRVELIENDV